MKNPICSRGICSNRSDRNSDQLREIKITCNAFGYADSSVLLQMGNTKVLCAVTLQPGVPHFLKISGKNESGKFYRKVKSGWLTAEYAMLPSATAVRTTREISSMRRNGRSVEISRLIGRSLRTIVDLSAIGERTIIIDCDVLQADGGTRTACITGANIALKLAVDKWLNANIIKETILTDEVAAVSVGVLKDDVLLDLDFSEDSKADADFNFVLTKSGKIVEMQGGSEGATVAWDQFEEAKRLAISGIKNLFAIGDQIIQKKSLASESKISDNKKVPLFSLQNRKNITV